MDPLSEVLSLLKPKSYLTAGFDAGGEWAIHFGNRPGTIKCHAVMAGECWLRIAGSVEDVRVKAGDCIILPSGLPFTLGSDLSVLPATAHEVLGHAGPGDWVSHQGGGDFSFIGTRFEVDIHRSNALLGILPPLIHLHERDDRATMRWYIEQMMMEMRNKRPGGALAAAHLAHLMLVLAFRLHLSRQAANRVGLLYAIADPHLGKAVEAMHGNLSHRWTLEELAACASLSRTVFAKRFRERVGTTPIEYLTRWRMTFATERLLDGRATLSNIANDLGYESESAFSTAFRRVIGCSPRRYARARQRSALD